MEFEIVDKIHSDTIEMDDYEIIEQEVHSLSSSLLSPSSSTSSSSKTSSMITYMLSLIALSSYYWLLLIVISLLMLYIIRVIMNNDKITKFKNRFTSLCSLSTIDDELIKLEKELDNESSSSLSETFIIKLEIITDYVTNYVIYNDNSNHANSNNTNYSNTNTNTNCNDVKKYGEYICRIDKIIQTIVLPHKKLSIPTFMNYIHTIIMTNSLIELDKYIVKFNILPLLENKTFTTKLSNARDIYEKINYTNSNENLKNKAINDLKSSSFSSSVLLYDNTNINTNADVIREVLAFANAYNLDKKYNEDYNNTEIILQNLEKLEKEQMMKEKQRCLNEHVSLLQLGAERIKNKLLESSNTLMCDMIKNDDIMLLEMSDYSNQTGPTSNNNYDNINSDNNDDNGKKDANNKIDISYENNMIIKSTTTSLRINSNKPSNEQLVLFNNDTKTAMISLPNNNNTLVLVDKTGSIVNNPDIKQQFALTIHKVDTDIINLNKDTGLEIAKAVKEYNQSIDDSFRHLDEEWKKSREMARVRVEKKIADALLEDSKFSLALLQNKKMTDKLDMYTNHSNENTYVCHQKWKTIQQQWDAIFYVLTLTISFCFFIRTSSSDTVITWFSVLSTSLCKEIADNQLSKEKLAESCNENNYVCSNDISTVWWTYDPFSPVSYVLGIIIYNIFTFLAYFRLSLSSMDYVKCFMNLVSRIMTPILISILVYRYSHLAQLSKYILVIGSCICLYTPIIRFFWPFRHFSYLILCHTIFHFVILGLEWRLTWRLSFLKTTTDIRWFCVYFVYPVIVIFISAFLGCKQYYDAIRKQEISNGYSVDQEDLFTLSECVLFKFFAY